MNLNISRRTAGWLTALLLFAVFNMTSASPRQRDVTVTNDGVALAGTFSMPETGTPRAVIIFLTGSGAQDRDETIGRHKPFRTISDSLTAHGYATLRLDDRGAGKSAGDAHTATIDTEATDAAAAIAWCHSLPELRNVPVGLLGHSQGGAVAITLAGAGRYFPSPEFIITYGAPTVKGTEMMLAQVKALLDAQGQGSAWSTLKPMLARRYELVASDMAADKLRDTLRNEVLASVPEQMRTNEAVLQRMESELQVMTGEPYRSLMRFDPTDMIPYISIPWLCLYGENDLQVPPEANGIPHPVAPNITRCVLPRLNHLGQQTDNGLPNLYDTIDEDVNPILIDAITGWLNSTIRK